MTYSTYVYTGTSITNMPNQVALKLKLKTEINTADTQSYPKLNISD